MTVARPTRVTVDGRAYLDLQNLARRQQRPTDELHQLYALEGFLARLAASPHATRFVLKGGVLLAAYDARRPTRDVDLQARDMWTAVTWDERCRRSPLTRACTWHRSATCFDGYEALAQPRWSAWRRKQRLDDRVPEPFGELLAAVVAFADPAIRDIVRGLIWRAESAGWI